MRIPHSPTLAALATAGFMLAGTALAQCPPQRLTSPSDLAGEYGYVLAMNERHLIVGDWRDHTLCGDIFCANGYAWAYERDGDGHWVFTQRLEPADLGWSAGFGRQIALDGDRVLITRALGADCGGVPYLFEFDGERWVETARLCPPPGRGDDGDPVALHGDMALTSTGFQSVLIHHEVDGQWSVVQELSNPDSPTMRSDYGDSFTLDDDWVIVGAYGERITAPGGGAVYVYRRQPGGTVGITQKLVAPDIAEGPRYGFSMAIEGRTLVVSAINATRDSVAQGVVYIYDLVDSRWELVQEITHAEPAFGDWFGYSIALAGNTMVIGAVRKPTDQGTGAAFVFRREVDGRWHQAAELLPQRDTYDFGEDVSLAGSTAAVGAPDALTARGVDGAVDLFDLSCYLCPADLDADGALTIFDFLTFLNLFQDADPLADFNGDGELTIFDFLAFQTAFDAGCA
jgi:hypothetical protein